MRPIGDGINRIPRFISSKSQLILKSTMGDKRWVFKKLISNSSSKDKENHKHEEVWIPDLD